MQVLDVLKRSAFKLICYRKAMVFVFGNKVIGWTSLQLLKKKMAREKLNTLLYL